MLEICLLGWEPADASTDLVFVEKLIRKKHPSIPIDFPHFFPLSTTTNLAQLIRVVDLVAARGNGVRTPDLDFDII